MPAILDEAGNTWHKEEDQQQRMMEGADGSHLCIPFQCKLCWYHNLEERDPVPGRDDVYLTCICQANIDTMLGKSPLTIGAHRRQSLNTIDTALTFRKLPAYHLRGPFLMDNPVGMSLAVDILLKSLIAKGRLVDHVQFATLRKLRSMYTKNWESSFAGIKEGAAFANGKYRVRQTSCPAQSEWFHDFLRGLEYRMGCQSDLNHGLLIGAIFHLLGLMKANAEEAEEFGLELDANKLWKVGAYVCVLMAAPLWGHECFYLELVGIRKHLGKEKQGEVPLGLDKSIILTEEMCSNLPHVTICLLGKFKGETGANHHTMAVANSTVLGLEPQWWLEKLIDVCKAEERTYGPTFATSSGKLALSMDYNSVFCQYLKLVQDGTDLIPEDQEVDTCFSTNRMPQKTSVTRLKQVGIGDEFIGRVNRWRSQDQRRGNSSNKG
jgi:hypothetical protein